METKIFDITALDEQGMADLREAADILRKGGLVAFPTETVYGLGADALNPVAVASIFLAKGRPADNPLIVHIADPIKMKELASSVPARAEQLAAAFWPGPLTLVLPKKESVPAITTGGLDTVAIRMPDDPVALALIELAGCSIAAPSANRSGQPSPTKGEHVVRDMDGRIDAILRSWDCEVGIESTVLDLTEEVPIILRPGIVTPEEISHVLGVTVEIDRAIRETESESLLAPKSPGMKYAHYAPKAEMLVLRGPANRIRQKMDEITKERQERGETVGRILFEETGYREAARDFFSRLREMDDRGVDLILAAALDESHSLGYAVMNRMLKSAGYHVINV